MKQKISKAYRFLWLNTTGEPYTSIMRRKPVLLLAPAIGLIVLLRFIRLSYGEPWGTVAVVFAIVVAFLAGHVFWGKKTTHLEERYQIKEEL